VPHITVPEGKADPEVRVWALRPDMGIGAGALSHAIYDQSIVPVRERELARMRIAQINGCIICQQWRATPGAEGMVSEDDYDHVLEWRDHDGYSERERLAID
jgi:alkylhydroperoxidase family enzyme